MNRLAAAGWLLRMHSVITQSSFAFGAIIRSITSQIAFSGPLLNCGNKFFYSRIPHFVRSSHSSPIFKTCWPCFRPVHHLRFCSSKHHSTSFHCKAFVLHICASGGKIIKQELYDNVGLALLPLVQPLHSRPLEEKLASKGARPRPTELSWAPTTQLTLLSWFNWVQWAVIRKGFEPPKPYSLQSLDLLSMFWFKKYFGSFQRAESVQ